jgi:hypothetical protein
MRVVVGGLAVMTGVTLAIELLFQKDLASLKPFSLAIALIGIWFPVSAIQLFFLKKDGKLPYYVPPKPKKQRTRDRDDEFEDEDRSERRRPPREKSREREVEREERTERRRPRQQDEDEERD